MIIIFCTSEILKKNKKILEQSWSCDDGWLPEKNIWLIISGFVLLFYVLPNKIIWKQKAYYLFLIS